MVNTSAYIIVFLQPNLSNIKPQIILPNPLQTDNTPTIVTAKVSASPLAREISFAMDITVFPQAAKNVITSNAFQKEILLSISANV